MGAPVPLFAVVAPEAEFAVDPLRLHPGLRFVESPRTAGVLLVVGGLSRSIFRPLLAVHDQISHPRATIWWPLGPGGARLTKMFPSLVRIEAPPSDPAAVAAVIRGVHEALLLGKRDSDPAILPDEDPAPWRGLGPYGQGGKGMTGGVPYGRPLAGRAPDRDGLELDVLPLRIGPFFPAFPSGLILDLRVQGGVVQEASVAALPVPGHGSARFDPFRRALTSRVPIADLEGARARHHLRWAAGFLRTHGLAALADRALLVAGAADLSARDVAKLRSAFDRARTLAWATRGVGIVPRERIAGAGLGPVARSAGAMEDARTDDEAYLELGFAPVTTDGADAYARWRQRLAEADQALELARAAGDLHAGGTGLVESPRGRVTVDSDPSSRLAALLPSLLAGQDWGDAVTTVTSLDIGPPPRSPPGVRAAAREVA